MIAHKGRAKKPRRRRTYVYIVECRDGSYYTGLSIDVKKRLGQHNSGKGAKYTLSRRPVKLVHVETCTSLSAALKRERQIKQMKRAQKETLTVARKRWPKGLKAYSAHTSQGGAPPLKT